MVWLEGHKSDYVNWAREYQQILAEREYPQGLPLSIIKALNGLTDYVIAKAELSKCICSNGE